MLQVTCALIEHEGRVLATRRSPSMPLPGKWEFPGGKIEPGESAIACLHREIMEELGIHIDIIEAYPPHHYQYPERLIELLPFRCRYVSGTLQLAEHDAARWLSPPELPNLDWAAADVGIVEKYLFLMMRDE